MAESIENLVTKIKSLPNVNQKRISALLGATVADAATRPLHWVYDQKTLDDVLEGSSQPEFWPESQCPFYTIPLGVPSNYNDMVLTSLSSLYENNGKLDIQHVCESFKKHFGEGSAYADALARRPTDRSKLPIDGPWIQKGMISFLDKYGKGQTENLGSSEDKEYDGLCAALPIIIQHAGKENMWAEAFKVTPLLNTDINITNMFHAAALLVDSFIVEDPDPMEKVKSTVETLYPEVHELINEVQEAKSLPFIQTVAKFGKACYLPGSFQGALLAMVQTSSFVDAVRLNMTAGGCSCSRSNLIGACYGAKYGIDGIPLDWLKKVKDIERIAEMAIHVLNV